MISEISRFPSNILTALIIVAIVLLAIKRTIIRADSLEQVVLLELKRMVCYLKNHEQEFAELLERKTEMDSEYKSHL